MSERMLAVCLVATTALAVCVVATAPLASAAAPTAGARPSPPLRHAGRWITDARGRVVILHGMDMVYKLPPYAPSATGFDADDAAFLSNHGFNTVRLGVLYVAVEPQPGSYDNAYLSEIARTVRTLGRHGVYSLLDFHQDMYNELFQGEGEPAWSVQDDGLSPAPRTGFPGNYAAMPALERAFDHLWENSPGPGGVGLEDRYIGAWRHVAAFFRGNRYVMGDDLFNEPWPGSQWPTCANLSGCPAFDKTTLAPFMHKVIAAIHSVNRRAVTYYEPNVFFDFGADTSIGKPGDAKSGMSFHDYCLGGEFGAPQSGFGGLPCQSAEQRVFQNADAQSRRTGDALLLTEFGSTNDLAVIQRIAGEADQHMVGWDYWAYCGCGDPTGAPQTEGLVNNPAKAPRGSNVRAGKLAVLDRAYPQAVAGIPTSFSYDPATDVFRLSYSTVRASGHGRFPAGSETDIYIPLLHYPHGYAVRVTGAAPISARGAAVLRLVSCPGQHRVKVRVTRRGRSSSNCASPAAARHRASRGHSRRRDRQHRRPRSTPLFTG